MKQATNFILLYLLSLTVIRCGGGESSAFPMDRKYWTPDDYHAVNSELTNLKYNNKELPSLDNPATAAIVNKIADTTNFTVVATDQQLGITHRAEFMSGLFDEYRELTSPYEMLDRQDKYRYPRDLAAIMKFGLGLQLYYLRTGNEKILKEADDPKEASILNLVQQNHNILIRNYDVYLDEINHEDRFNDAALITYSEGLREYFPRLTSEAPDGNFSDMLVKIGNMLKKAKNPLVIAALQQIQGILEPKATQPARQMK